MTAGRQLPASSVVVVDSTVLYSAFASDPFRQLSIDVELRDPEDAAELAAAMSHWASLPH